MKKKKSIIVDDMEHCKLCGSPYVEIHHCLYGTANRKKADKYNLVIPLCHEHHTGGKQSAHLNARYDLMYKKMAQKAFEEKIGTREEFIKVLTARKRIKESVNTAYRYGYAKRN